MNFDISLNTIIVPLLAGSCTILAIFLQRKTEKIKIIEGQLSQSKYKAYSELVSIFYDLLKNNKLNKETTDDYLIEKLLNAKKDLLIYGSDEVFKKLNDWFLFTSKKPDNLAHINIFLDLLILIRKDMGNKETSLSRKDIMISIMQSEEEYNKFLASYN